MNDLEVNDLDTGWLKESNVLRRQVDIIVNDDGALFVGGDGAGVYGVVDVYVKHYCNNNNCVHNNYLQK